jgi:hypothetical protein
VSRGIAWFSFILYGENKLHMDSYVISLNYIVMRLLFHHGMAQGQTASKDFTKNLVF